MTLEYKIHQWYRGGYDNRFYYYFWAIVNGHLLGAEYDIEGNFTTVDAWDDEAFTRTSDASFVETDVEFDEWDGDEQGMVEELLRVFWGWCQ